MNVYSNFNGRIYVFVINVYTFVQIFLIRPSMFWVVLQEIQIRIFKDQIYILPSEVL